MDKYEGALLGLYSTMLKLAAESINKIPVFI